MEERNDASATPRRWALYRNHGDRQLQEVHREAGTGIREGHWHPEGDVGLIVYTGRRIGRVGRTQGWERRVDRTVHVGHATLALRTSAQRSDGEKEEKKGEG